MAKPNTNRKSRRPKADRDYRKDKMDVNQSSKDWNDRAKGSNDASWYTRNSQLALDAGRIAFTWPNGSNIDLDPYQNSNNNTIIMGASMKPTFKFPGVMSLNFVPSYGITNEPTDPINISAKNIYSWVRHANSGHSNYDAPDLMLYILAVDNVYMLYQHMCRIYGLLRMFAQKNRHMPETILRALHVDYNDFLSNMADFRAYINTTAVKIGSLCVPNTMPLFQRHAWMTSGVYADSPSIKSQFYVFTPIFLGKYEELSGAGQLVATAPLGNESALLTYATLKSIMNDMISRIIESEDMNIMSGDILKAYGENGIMKIAMIGDEYMIAPQYNEEVLRQIQNATIMNGVGLVNGRFIYQDVATNTLKSASVFDVCSRMYQGKRIMTGTSENPTPEEVLVNSRLIVTGTVEPKATTDGQSRYTFTPSSLGSEVVCWAEIYNKDKAGNFVKYETNYVRMYDEGTSLGAADNIAGFITLAYEDFFNYHPMFIMGTATLSSNAGPEKHYIHYDVDNYAIVDAHDVDKMHNTAMLSLFDVPQIGRI